MLRQKVNMQRLQVLTKSDMTYHLAICSNEVSLETSFQIDTILETREGIKKII